MAIKNDDQALRTEANSFANYLISKPASDEVIQLYGRGLRSGQLKLSDFDIRLLNFARKRSWSIGYLDAGLAILNPRAELRRRLYIMLAILETIPAHANEFLPRQRSRLYLFMIIWLACRAGCKTIVGLILVRVVA